MKRTPLSSDPEKTRAWQQRSRKPLRQQSKKRQRESKGNRDVTEAVFERDGWSCKLRDVPETGPCFGPLTPHHLRKASAGGKHTADNLVSLCARHNTWVEDFPMQARDLGLVIR